MSQHDALVAAIRKRKEFLNISNESIEQACQLTSGHFDKLCGFSPVRGLTKFTIDLFCEYLAVDIVLVPNEAKEKRWSSTWEQRDQRAVRLSRLRISKAVMEAAKPAFHRAMARAGGLARAALLSSTQRSEISRKAAKAKHRKAARCRRRA